MVFADSIQIRTSVNQPWKQHTCNESQRHPSKKRWAREGDLKAMKILLASPCKNVVVLGVREIWVKKNPLLSFVKKVPWDCNRCLYVVFLLLQWRYLLSPFYRRSWHSKIKTFPWGHTARRRQSWSLTPGLSNANALISVSHQQSIVVVSSKQVHRLPASHCPDLTELVASDPFCHSVLRALWVASHPTQEKQSPFQVCKPPLRLFCSRLTCKFLSPPSLSRAVPTLEGFSPGICRDPFPQICLLKCHLETSSLTPPPSNHTLLSLPSLTSTF